METIILKYNLFCIYCRRSVTFISSYFLLTYSRVTYEISARKTSGPQNTQEKKIWIHEKPTKKNFGSPKHPREEVSGPRSYDGTRLTRQTMTRDPRSIANSSELRQETVNCKLSKLSVVRTSTADRNLVQITECSNN